MIRLRIPRSALSLVLLSLIVLLPACTPKPVEEPVDSSPPAPTAPAEADMPDSEVVEEVIEPWDRDLVPEEPIPASQRAAEAQEINEQGILGDIFFGFDKSDLSEEARNRLAGHSRWLRAHREFGLLIEGHCDERDTDEYNLALGDSRANAARDYLILLGIEAPRLQTISYGEERPVDPGHSESAWSKNRRGHFVVQVLEGAGL